MVYCPACLPRRRKITPCNIIKICLFRQMLHCLLIDFLRIFPHTSFFFCQNRQKPGISNSASLISLPYFNRHMFYPTAIPLLRLIPLPIIQTFIPHISHHLRIFWMFLQFFQNQPPISAAFGSFRLSLPLISSMKN